MEDFWMILRKKSSGDSFCAEEKRFSSRTGGILQMYSLPLEVTAIQGFQRVLPGTERSWCPGGAEEQRGVLLAWAGWEVCRRFIALMKSLSPLSLSFSSCRFFSSF